MTKTKRKYLNTGVSILLAIAIIGLLFLRFIDIEVES